MKKIVIVFGLISGLIVSSMLLVVLLCYNNPDFEGNMLLGYSSMLIAFSFIFVAVKQYRDKHNNGVISFGKAFRIGLYITLIASTLYVLVWLIEYYAFIPDFMDKYAAHMMHQAEKNGATPAELKEQAESMQNYKEMYKNPVLVVLMTYMEVFPIGLVVALIAALILKKKLDDSASAITAHPQV